MRILALVILLATSASVSAQPCAPTVIVMATKKHVPVEEALTPEQRVRGLMHRKSLKPNTGMWFVFDSSKPRSFWMRNTTISLDLVFVDDQGVVVRVIERAMPLSERALRSLVPARYVLEVNAGEAAALGIKRGGQLRVCGTEGPKRL